MDNFHVSFADRIAVEFRVLPLRRFIKDQLYWAWVRFWFSMPLPIFEFVFFRLCWLDGCRRYFEWRDDVEYPAIGRFYVLRWMQWRRVRFPEAR